MIDAFTKATGVKVDIARESYEDVQPKASVAANTGTGPDLFWGLYSLPHLFPQKCVDVTDVADYLGKKYGGWVPSAVIYGKSGNKWIEIPICYPATCSITASKPQEGGDLQIPGRRASVPRIRQSDEEKQHAGRVGARSRLGRRQWLGALVPVVARRQTVDKSDKVIINSPETAKALDYAKELYENMIPGVASWNDASNNKAFLAGEINWTDNGISIYVAAQKDPTKKQIADDMDHAYWPVGPIGKPTELHLMYPALAMTYTKYPQACKALMAFMLEADNFNPWIQSRRAISRTASMPTTRTRFGPRIRSTRSFREAAKRTLTAGGLGSVGEKAATAIADFVVLDMFANYCTGREDVKGSIAIAERQLKRIYR